MLSSHSWPGRGQRYPASISQFASQPSPLVVLPSSHSSEPLILLSPHACSRVQGWPATGHTNDVFCTQVELQPSSSTVLPSSHCSTPLTRTPSPHTIVLSHGSP